MRKKPQMNRDNNAQMNTENHQCLFVRLYRSGNPHVGRMVSFALCLVLSLPVGAYGDERIGSRIG
jgi:hypothetical protein